MEAGDEGCCGLFLLSNWDDLDVGVEEEVEAGYVVPTSEVYADIEKKTGVRLWSLWWSGNGVGMASGAVIEKNHKREMETALYMMTMMTAWCACDGKMSPQVLEIVVVLVILRAPQTNAILPRIRACLTTNGYFICEICNGYVANEQYQHSI